MRPQNWKLERGIEEWPLSSLKNMLSFLKADRNKILVDNLIYNLVSYSKIIALYQERYPHMLFLSQETVWSSDVGNSGTKSEGIS